MRKLLVLFLAWTMGMGLFAQEPFVEFLNEDIGYFTFSKQQILDLFKNYEVNFCKIDTIYTSERRIFPRDSIVKDMEVLFKDSSMFIKAYLCSNIVTGKNASRNLNCIHITLDGLYGESVSLDYEVPDQKAFLNEITPLLRTTALKKYSGCCPDTD